MNLLKSNPIAKIIDRSEAGITFQVDDVQKLSLDVPTEGAFRHFTKRNEAQLLASSHNDSVEVVQDYDVHPMAAAVHLAFSQHRPLRLTPDHIWLTIAQGFAHHVNNNADTLRPTLVGFPGKMVLQIRTSSLEDAEDWAQVINKWTEDIGDFIPPELHQTLLCDFTTTTATTRIASQVVMMDAFQRFFDYRVICICGIPSVTLAGTVEDWQRISSRVRHLEQYDLQWWTDRLLPICEALVETAGGKPSLEFWQNVYKPEGVYGEEVITGWLADLFPYILDSSQTKASSPTLRNPILSLPRRKLRVENGITPSRLPRGLSRVPATMETLTMENEIELLAGFIGVKLNRQQDAQLEPEIGWGIREAEKLPRLFNQIKLEHQTEAAFVLPDPNDFGLNPEFPNELYRMLAEFDGATLYPDTDHPWRIRPSSDYDQCNLRGLNLGMTRFIDLADGRCISYTLISRVTTMTDGTAGRRQEQLWLVVGKPEKHFDLRSKAQILELKRSEVKVIAKGLEQLFERILRADGRYFFDEMDFVPEDKF